MLIAFCLPDQHATGGVGGAAYVAAMAAAMAAAGHQVALLEGPAPDLPPGAAPVIDTMLLPALLPRLDALVAADAVALVHHLGAAAGQDEAARRAAHEMERSALPRFRRVVATSAPVATRLAAEFGVPEPHILLPGVADLPRSDGPAAESVQILSVGVLTPRKGHDRLLRAMARLTDLDWHLTIAGDARRNPVHAAAIEALIEALQLGGRATVLRNPDPAVLGTAWDQAGLFALATSWEGYATAVAEALRRGIPAVVTQGGESGTLLTQDCGAVCALDDPATLGKCLRRLLFDRALRLDMAEQAWRVGQALPGWAEQARGLETILRS